MSRLLTPAVVLLSCACLAPIAPSQEAGASGASQDVATLDDGDDAAPTLDPAVTEVLARAAAHQRGSAEVQPTGSLHGRFLVRLSQPDARGSLEFDVERTYTRDPARIVSTRSDTIVGSRTTVGFDGTTGWFRDEKGGQVRRFDEDPETFARDLADLDWNLRLMRLVHDALAIEDLASRLEGVRLEAPTALELPLRSRSRRNQRPPVPVDRVAGLMVDDLFPAEVDLDLPPDEDAPPPMLAIELAVGAESGELVRLELRTVGRPTARDVSLWFMNYGTNRQGLRVPQTIKLFEDGLERAVLGIEPDDDGRAGFSLGLPVDDALFAPPREG